MCRFPLPDPPLHPLVIFISCAVEFGGLLSVFQVGDVLVGGYFSSSVFEEITEALY